MNAIQTMWDAFDLVGVTEHFDEFVVLLTDLVGLQVPAYRSQLATAKTTAAREAAQRWTRRTCASLTADPPAELLQYITRRMQTSLKAATEHKKRRGRGDSRGPPGMMDCGGYGPCEVPGLATHHDKVAYRWLNESLCEAVSPVAVLTRLCARMETDEPLYNTARAQFDTRMHLAGATLASRVELLRRAGAELAARAEEQEALPASRLQARTGVRLSRAYVASSGGGAAWRVDEFAPWYKPHERARYSCEGCSGDVVPEFDLIGCWPLWAQFGPDELRLRCTRRWTSDPGLNQAAKYLAPGSTVPMPCWQTCWEPLPGASGGGADQPHCTPACDAELVEPAVAWRARWDTDLAAFNREGIGHALQRATEFRRALRDTHFMWNVF